MPLRSELKLQRNLQDTSFSRASGRSKRYIAVVADRSIGINCLRAIPLCMVQRVESIRAKFCVKLLKDRFAIGLIPVQS
jgi:hypothetical protein